MEGPAPSLRSLVDLYLLRCEVEGKSPRTVRAYRETLTRFQRSVGLDDVTAIRGEHIYAYLDEPELADAARERFELAVADAAGVRRIHPQAVDRYRFDDERQRLLVAAEVGR